MAFLEQRGKWYRIVFTLGGKRYSHSVHTYDKRVADAIRGGIDRTILQICQRLLVVPEGADVKEFILSSGQSMAPKTVSKSAVAGPSPVFVEPLITLVGLKEKYLAALRVGAVEENSPATPLTATRPLARSWV